VPLLLTRGLVREGAGAGGWGLEGGNVTRGNAMLAGGGSDRRPDSTGGGSTVGAAAQAGAVGGDGVGVDGEERPRKSARTERADGRKQLLITAPLQAPLGKITHCAETELVPLLLSHSLVTRVKTLRVEVRQISGEEVLHITLNAALSSVGAAKAEIAKVQVRHALHAIPHTPHTPTPCTTHPYPMYHTPYPIHSAHPNPHTLHTIPHTLHMIPQTLCTLYAILCTLYAILVD
jgi:hypothetical protein